MPYFRVKSRSTIDYDVIVEAPNMNAAVNKAITTIRHKQLTERPEAFFDEVNVKKLGDSVSMEELVTDKGTLPEVLR